MKVVHVCASWHYTNVPLKQSQVQGPPPHPWHHRYVQGWDAPGLSDGLGWALPYLPLVIIV